MAQREIGFTSNSGNIESISYDSETQELTIVFRGGRSYSYQGVPESVAIGFESAPSAGTYFHQFIKGVYE